MVFGGGFSSAATLQRKGEPVPYGTSTVDGPENLLARRGVPLAEARRMDLMMVNAWRPFSYPVADNPLAVLDWSSVDPADLCRIPAGLPMVRADRIHTQAYRQPCRPPTSDHRPRSCCQPGRAARCPPP
jgi:hypothetical protein